jgi:hypothetical protein
MNYRLPAHFSLNLEFRLTHCKWDLQQVVDIWPLQRSFRFLFVIAYRQSSSLSQGEGDQHWGGFWSHPRRGRWLAAGWRGQCEDDNCCCQLTGRSADSVLIWWHERCAVAILLTWRIAKWSDADLYLQRECEDHSKMGEAGEDNLWSSLLTG